jgi:1,5-anhydro-D-fructose reductase (1,5-anhydro-D-mannitol-forming)
MLRWGIVGVGRVSAHMATAIAQSESGELVGVVGRRPERAEEFAAKYQAQTYASVSDLSDKVDVVYVASPNSMHRDHVLAAATKGIHVLCEKPLASSVSDATAIVQACKENDVVLGMGVQYRQHPAHRHIRDEVRAGSIGAPIFADASVHLPPLDIPDWYDDQAVAAGGVLPMSGVHRIDLLRYVLDAEVVAVSAIQRTRRASRPFEDTVAGILEFDSGAIATIRFAMEARSDGEGVSVNGESGWLRAERTTSSWWAEGQSALRGQTTDADIDFTYEPLNLYRLQVEEFNAAVESGSSFSSSGLDGVQAAVITDAIFQSALVGERVTIQRGDHE